MRTCALDGGWVVRNAGILTNACAASVDVVEELLALVEATPMEGDEAAALEARFVFREVHPWAAQPPA